CCCHQLSTVSHFSLSSFFFYSYALRRSLPSFPTRRSSDLIAESAVFFSSGGAKASKFLIPQPSQKSFNRSPSRKNCRPYLRASIDRKSTRLNSSHVKISYAVFCLKKKKYQNTKYNTDIPNI